MRKGGQRPSQGPKTLQTIQLAISNIGHCIFCLRKVVGANKKCPSAAAAGSSNFGEDDDGEHLCQVPEAVALSPNFISTLNEIWPYMQTSWKKKMLTNGNEDLILRNVLLGLGRGYHLQNSLSGSKNASLKSAAFTFSQLPPICQFCADKVQAVDDLMTALRLKMAELRGVIMDSKKMGLYSWRGEQFESRLMSATGVLGEDVVTSTLKFFDALGSSSDDQDKSTYQPENTTDDHLSSMPVSPPPNFKKEPSQDSKLIEIERASSSSQLKWIKEESDEGEDDEDFDGGPVDMNSEGHNESSDEDNVEETTSNVGAERDERSNSHPTVKIERTPNCISIITAKKQKLTVDVTSLTLASESTDFPCALATCGKIFPNKYILKRHMRDKHRETKKFSCSCGLYFLSYALRQVHRRESGLHPPEEKNKSSRRRSSGRPKMQQTCDLCGIKLTASEILEHVHGHVGDYAMKCPNDNCSQMYSSYISFVGHVRRSIKCKEAFGNDKEFSCETCGFKANTYYVLKVHMNNFHERDPNKSLKCPIASCDKTFCVRQSVHFHLSSHLFSDTTLQTCEYCHKRIKTEEMGEHLKSEHDAEEIITCQQCPFSFISRASLVEHLFVHRHNGMCCDICCDNVKYTRHTDIREHYQSIHNVIGKQYVCEQCGLTFWKKASWTDHMRFKHSMKDEETPSKEKKKWSCDACLGKVEFCSEPPLIAHKISAHGETPFTCTLCGATFKFKVHLSRHQKEHAGIPIKKEFKCDVPDCGKVFINKRNWKTHVSIVHLGQRDHVCDLCGKGYGSKEGLRHHHEIFHLGLRPYCCDTCGESFTSGTVLKRHKLIHTGERPFACELCGQTFRHKEVLKRHLEAHEKKGSDFKPNGPMKQIRKRKAQ